jgi:signal transduction histidine kinase
MNGTPNNSEYAPAAGIPSWPSRITIPAAWALLVGSYAVMALVARPGPGLTAFGDVAQCVAALFAAFCLLLNASASQPRTKAFWALMGFGCSLWMLGQFGWTYFEVVLRQPVPNPFIGDVILFVHAVPMMAAVAVQPHDTRADLNVHLGYLDFALLLVWWVYLYFFIVIPWQYIAPDVARYGYSYDQLEGVENLLLAIGLAVLFVRSRDAWRNVYGHLCGAATLFAVGVYVINEAIDRHTYHTGSAYDVPLVAAFVWLGTTGIRALRLAPPAAAASAPMRDSSLWPGRFAIAAVLSMPLLALWSLTGSAAPPEVRKFRVAVTLIAILVVAMLIFLRQRLVDMDRIRLLRAAQESVENLTRLQTQLVQTEKLASLGQLAAGAAHEINNPLTGILGYSDLLVDNNVLDDKSRVVAEKIRTLARRIKTLVASLLSFSRQVPTEKSLLDLTQVLSSALHLGTLDMRGKHIQVKVENGAALPRVHGDANQLLQVFFNVMNNAVDAMEEVGGGTLTIRIAQVEDNAVIEFSDTGPGVAAPHLVFDPFFTTKPVGKGTGLGLSICYGIIQEHGGRIDCFNRPEGGATFRIELPAVLEQTSDPERSVHVPIESR